MAYHVTTPRRKSPPPAVQLTPCLIRALEADLAAAGILASPTTVFNVVSRPSRKGTRHDTSR